MDYYGVHMEQRRKQSAAAFSITKQKRHQATTIIINGKSIDAEESIFFDAKEFSDVQNSEESEPF